MESNDIGSQLRGIHRLWSAIRRRFRYGWQVLKGDRPAWVAVERARNWLERQPPIQPILLHPDRDKVIQCALKALRMFEQGKLEEGDKVLHSLKSFQRRDGSFPFIATMPEASGTAAESNFNLSFPNTLAAKLFLEACEAQVNAHIRLPTVNLPQKIAPEDGRLLALIEWMNDGNRPPAKVIDVGCGPGRFLNHLVDLFPQTKWEGLDPNASLLEHLPKAVKRRNACLYTSLRRAAYDGVYAVEVLEHCIYPERAIKVMCNALRTGGRLLIIDKHAAWQKYSEHEPWERWFKPREVCDWLEPYCTNIKVRRVAHGTNPKPSGLFLCWTAVRKRNDD